MIGVGTTIFLVNPATYPSATSYLLDTYTAAAAYSLRQLKTGVTNVVRVRRSSDNAESDFTADEITDGTLVAWTGANDGFVTKWYNQGTRGSSWDIYTTTATNQPRLVSSGAVRTKNGKPSVLYSSTDVSLAVGMGGLPEMDSGNVFTQFIVTAPTSAGVYAEKAMAQGIRFFTDSRTTPNRHIILTGVTGTTQYNLSTAYNNTNQVLKTALIDPAGTATWDNSNAGGTGTWGGGYSNNNDFAIGYGVNDTEWQEVIIFGSNESANRTAIESDINTHYSIY